MHENGQWDLAYVEQVSLRTDVRILIQDAGGADRRPERVVMPGVSCEPMCGGGTCDGSSAGVR